MVGLLVESQLVEVVASVGALGGVLYRLEVLLVVPVVLVLP